ncbi:hypothetical protein [Paracoccus aestuariivivens]|uniref:Uncharacterized protein n=1 Tax=Paracoccus aestuariivivens TaxID=1820333 RepID=A0A6L6JGE0_9RHOB|nr:hypothetical protein [Paracoccus aestuariivivens]MTH79637.1 hypothetical protein [Paracoccus aestuariivivens]
MPRLIHLYLVSILVGAGLGAVFTGLLVGLDVAGLRHLLTGSGSGLIGLFMLMFFHAALFSGVQFAISVMLMGNRNAQPPHGRGRLVIGKNATVLSPANAGNRR